MRKKTIAVVMAVIAAGSVVTRASDRIAVYGKVDRVVLEPNAEAPTAIQIWGVFAIAQAKNPNDYQPAARGYLYYALPAKADLARREWADLKAVAGTGTIVAFGSRWEGVPRLRQPNDPPAMPEPYFVNAGLTKIQGRVEYGPIRALLDFNR